MAASNRRTRKGDDRERGSASVEAVINSLLLVTFLIFGIGIARLVQAHGLVDQAAMQAARAAALAPPLNAASAASESAHVQLAGQRSCPTAHIHVRLAPPPAPAAAGGGTEIVEVACTVPLSDLFLAGFPGHETLTVTEAAPRNPYQQAT
jgi:hypothetical protein